MKKLTSLIVALLTVLSVMAPVCAGAGMHKPDPAMLYEAIEELEALDYDGAYADIINTARRVAGDPDLTYTKLGEQLDIFEGIRQEFRGRLNEILNEADERGMFETDSDKYALCRECESVWKDEDKTATEYFNAYTRVLMAIVSDDLPTEVLNIIESADSFWQYNYPEGAESLFEAAVNSVLGEYAAGKIDIDELPGVMTQRIAEVPTLKTYRVGQGTAFDGWTTQQVQNVLNKSDRVVDSIGTSLNTRNVWNNGDISANTVFTAGDGWFAMQAAGDFSNKSMGWKNMDRNGTITGTKMAATPVLGMTDLQNAEGIRFKMEMSGGGSVERILIGLSNCCTTTMESYALNIKPEYTDPSGYINIPFSYFVNAWWTDANFMAKRSEIIVFIVEAYGVTAGTELKFSDMQGYTTAKPDTPATKEQVNELNRIVSELENIELTPGENHFAAYYRKANEAVRSGIYYDV